MACPTSSCQPNSPFATPPTYADANAALFSSSTTFLFRQSVDPFRIDISADSPPQLTPKLSNRWVNFRNPLWLSYPPPPRLAHHHHPGLAGLFSSSVSKSTIQAHGTTRKLINPSELLLYGYGWRWIAMDESMDTVAPLIHSLCRNKTKSSPSTHLVPLISPLRINGEVAGCVIGHYNAR